MIADRGGGVACCEEYSSKFLYQKTQTNINKAHHKIISLAS